MRIFAVLLLLGLASEGWAEQTIDDNEIWSKGRILYLKEIEIETALDMVRKGWDRFNGRMLNLNLTEIQAFIIYKEKMYHCTATIGTSHTTVSTYCKGEE